MSTSDVNLEVFSRYRVFSSRGIFFFVRPTLKPCCIVFVFSVVILEGISRSKIVLRWSLEPRFLSLFWFFSLSDLSCSLVFSSLLYLMWFCRDLLLRLTYVLTWISCLDFDLYIFVFLFLFSLLWLKDFSFVWPQL